MSRFFLITGCFLLVAAPGTCTRRNAEVPSTSEDASSCGVYWAPSTIPGGGWGMFAGRSYQRGEPVSAHDIIIPMYEMDWHNGDGNAYENLWREYVWSASMFEPFQSGGETEDTEETVAIASGGFGAAVNCWLSLENVRCDSKQVQFDRQGATSLDPTAGSFTPFGGRQFRATRYVPAGMEFYADYGEDYFVSRAAIYGYLPLPDNYEEADSLIDSIFRLATPESSLARNLYALIQGKMARIWKNESRTLNALSPDFDAVLDEYSSTRKVNTGLAHYNTSIRSLEWLDKHGYCMDNIRNRKSSIPGAGQGAFATRLIPQGGLVAPAPLIHIPDRTAFVIYDSQIAEGNEAFYRLVRNVSAPIHHQLMLNYCFGHRESSLLLCPYGLLTSLINHAPSPEKVNARIQWSSQQRHKEWFQWPVDYWGDIAHSGLSFDFVATRPIAENEEIFIDYGSDWQNAWQEHVSSWVPRVNYTPAAELNSDPSLVLRTVYERPYEFDGVELYCKINGDFEPCLVLDRYSAGDSSTYFYMAALVVEEDDELDQACPVEKSVSDIGRILWGLSLYDVWFEDLPYSRDHHYTHSFRKEMGIPDDMFPDVWKNLLVDDQDIDTKCNPNDTQATDACRLDPRELTHEQ